MSLLVGQMYYPRFKEEVKDGETKISFFFSLATRKAFIEDKEKPNVFTPCVTYQAGLAKLLNEHFGKEEHAGKAIVVYGHFNEYDWYPDPANPDHDKYFQQMTVPREILEQGGVRFAEGSATQVAIMVPTKQTTRQFVVTGFEFADSKSTPTTPRQTTVPTMKLAGSTVTEAMTAGLPGTDGKTPF